MGSHFDPEQLRDLIDEISARDLPWRRQYLEDIERVYGTAASGQLKQELKRRWEERKRK